MEDGILGNLAPPGDLEESASHHYSSSLATIRKLALRVTLGASGKPSTWLPLVELADLPPTWGYVIFHCTSQVSNVTAQLFLIFPSFPWSI